METGSTLPITATPAQDKEVTIADLPQESSWHVSEKLYKYQGFWIYSNFLQGIILFQKRFLPQPNDILLCSFPKCGTTWLKSLCFAISTRREFQSPNNGCSLLATKMPHDIVPVQELLYCLGHERDTETPLIATHVPFTSLPESILKSDTKIIYLCRDPKDVLVSLWHFIAKKKLVDDLKVISFEEAYEKFCNEVSPYGPYWDHVLGYWKASKECSERVLFVKYEDMKNDTCSHVKKMADFMGCPFAVDEENEGIVEKIVELCSFETLSNLEVNKSKESTIHCPHIIENSAFFRKGEVGDWKNYLTAEMAERIDQITKDKFGGFGLYF